MIRLGTSFFRKFSEVAISRCGTCLIQIKMRNVLLPDHRTFLFHMLVEFNCGNYLIIPDKVVGIIPAVSTFTRKRYRPED